MSRKQQAKTDVINERPGATRREYARARRGQQTIKLAGETFHEDSLVRRQLALPGARRRLVRLCAQFTGNSDAAEDLAQEALLEAWCHPPALREPDLWQPWLWGIGRNVCRRWQRRQGRETARTVLPSQAAASDDGGSAFPDLDQFPAPAVPGFEVALEQAELASLLDRAMNVLPPQTRQILAQRCVDDLPPGEIASHLGMSENATAVRLHRGRLALRRVLTTHLREEAVAHGLIAPNENNENEDPWQETRIWCPRCGERRLMGRFVTEAGEVPHFTTRCPGCQHFVGRDFTTGHHALEAGRVLSGVKGFKPALSRVHAWWNQHYQAAVTRRQVSCGRCGRLARVQMTPPADANEFLRSIGGLYLVCPACRALGCVGLHGLALMLPETQRFWKRHPRMAALPARRDVRFDGHEAISVGFESRTENALVEVLLSRDTLARLHVHEP